MKVIKRIYSLICNRCGGSGQVYPIGITATFATCPVCYGNGTRDIIITETTTEKSSDYADNNLMESRCNHDQ